MSKHMNKHTINSKRSSIDNCSQYIKYIHIKYLWPKLLATQSSTLLRILRHWSITSLELNPAAFLDNT